jgi:lysophospholipid hydrolase
LPNALYHSSPRSVKFISRSLGLIDSPSVLHIDSALDWTQLNAGQVLWRPNDESDSVYIVINGRLRALIEQDNGEVSIVGEYGQGDIIGELDVITNSPRRTTVHAIRDTELARMPMTLFNAISMRHPQSTVQLLRRIASRVRDEVGDPSSMSSGVLPLPRPLNPTPRSSNLGTNNLNLKTVAILPSSKSVPVDAFAKRLQAALEDVGAPTSYLNQSAVMRHLGKHALAHRSPSPSPR